MSITLGKIRTILASQTALRLLFFALGITGVLATVALQPARAGRSAPAGIPANLRVPPGNALFHIGHATGTQNYICLSTGWAAYGPQAVLFDKVNEQSLTHFLSPNPAEANTPRPTWQDSRDSSLVWAAPVPGASFTPDPTAVPWLLLQVVGTAEGPTGGSRMAQTTYIQRIYTTGGLTPAGACTEGEKALVPYTADYLFYKAKGK